MSTDEQVSETAQHGHVLAIEVDAAYAERFPNASTEFRWSVECLDRASCVGWQECNDSHEMPGEPCNDGPWGSEETAPWYEEDEYKFHGAEHTWTPGYGWTIPFDGCVVAENDADCPVYPMRPGRWVVHDEWDDTWLTLELGEELHTRPGARP